MCEYLLWLKHVWFVLAIPHNKITSSSKAFTSIIQNFYHFQYEIATLVTKKSSLDFQNTDEVPMGYSGIKVTIYKKKVFSICI